MEMTPKKLLPRFSQVEQELHNSEIYQNAIAQWQNMTGTTVEAAQSLIDEIAKETMRVTFHLSFAPEAASATETVNPPQPAPTQPPKRTVSLSRFGNKAKPKNQELAESRAAQCRQIGSAIANARMAKNLSLEQVHVRTLIPICHIRALEAGDLDELPEDVYLRGFIRQIGNALGLNGVQLAAALPETQSSVVPSWYRAPKSNLGMNMNVSPVHLYLGYTALIAGAVGGLSFMSDHNDMNASMQLDLPDTVNPSYRDRESTQLDSTASEQAAVNMVPPETINN